MLTGVSPALRDTLGAMQIPRRILLACLAAATLAGCSKGSSAHSYRELNPIEAKAAFDSGASFVDANDVDYRAKNGTVPNAIMLDSSSRYDVAALLPAKKDTPLVFFCSSRT